MTRQQLKSPVSLPIQNAVQAVQAPTPPKKPLTEGAFANVLEAIRLLNVCSTRIRNAQGALELCGDPVDPAALEAVQEAMDRAYGDFQAVVMAHLDAMDAQKGKTK